MFCAPAVVCEISDPADDATRTSRSAPGLTTLILASLAPPAGAGELDLERRLRGDLVVHLERGVLDVEALAEDAWRRRRSSWQSSPARTTTWADRAGKPEVTSHTWRSWTWTTPG